jgi:predicted acetyltransferase
MPFFVVRGLRRDEVGLLAARELLALIPGVWAIAFQDANADAQPFWERVATDAVGDRWHLEEGGRT